MVRPFKWIAAKVLEASGRDPRRQPHSRWAYRRGCDGPLLPPFLRSFGTASKARWASYGNVQSKRRANLEMAPMAGLKTKSLRFRRTSR